MAPAKILADFAKEHEKPRIKAAVVDGRLFDEKAIAMLAMLPSREVLLSQVLATVIAPMTTFLAVIEATLDYTNGDNSRAARLLNIGRKTLYRKLEQFEAECDPAA